MPSLTNRVPPFSNCSHDHERRKKDQSAFSSQPLEICRQCSQPSLCSCEQPGFPPTRKGEIGGRKAKRSSYSSIQSNRWLPGFRIAPVSARFRSPPWPHHNKGLRMPEPGRRISAAVVTNRQPASPRPARSKPSARVNAPIPISKRKRTIWHWSAA